ncbi:hypothetical protein FOCG_16193 [Fusarium oxysporum f. sp. radicis-lycopersici 26381]|nr:hypothetical protein FOWG_09999 [Fusarium oxysporum f. sp. lycopersici MN25]EXL41386.1 hypothetical protein FOCG_16193 [Fusarium oxysporum f. sp. radicis-lycopersici 26381]RKL19452.1 hypothetical protein BFJ70_g13939 [Fusarium oxysporum]
MSRTKHFLPPLVGLIFAILAFVFSILTITSREWAIRMNYDPDPNPQTWDKPTYTLYRSPFIICREEQVNSTNPNADPVYSVHCDHFKPYGHNKTTCELMNVTDSDVAENLGDQRLCQQIHLAGNYAIASTVFIGVGFLATMTLAFLSLLRSVSTHRHKHESDHRSNNRALPLLTLVTLAFLFVGFVTALISQFYGIMGFIVSLPNQSDFASSQGSGSSDEAEVHGFHGPWFQGKALSVYATLAWGFTIATGTMVSLTWRLPRWNV